MGRGQRWRPVLTSDPFQEASVDAPLVFYRDTLPEITQEAYAIPLLKYAPYVHFPITIGRIVAALMALPAWLFMFGVWWFKLAIEDEITVYDYLTNLVWISIGTYYLLYCIGFAESLGNHAMDYLARQTSASLLSSAGGGGLSRKQLRARPDYILYFQTLAVGVPLLGTTTGVTITVMAVIQDSPGLLFNYVSEYGEGTVVNANTIMHVLTTLSVILHIFLTLDQYRHVLFVKFTSLLRITLINITAAVAALLTYAFGHSISTVYNLDSNLPTVVVMIIFTVVIVAVVCVFNLIVSPWNVLLAKDNRFWKQLRKQGSKRPPLPPEAFFHA